MTSNYGILPATDQIEAAKIWIEDRLTPKAGARSNAEAD
jgi:hypothetical protein